MLANRTVLNVNRIVYDPDMSYGLSTRQVGAPIGANLRNRFSIPARYVPLSQFFLMNVDDGKEPGLYGRRLKKQAPKSEKSLAQPAALPESGAPGVYKSGPGGPSSGFTGTGNVPQVAVPIGPKRKRGGNLLRRVIPIL